MSARHRPRNNHNQDADEERRLWNQIKADAKKIDGMVARSSAIGTEIVEVEKQQAALVESNQPSSAELDDRLESLYRENVRISETVQHIIEGKSDDMNLLDSIKVLAGLREASEESSQILPSSSSRSSTGKASRSGQLPKRKGTVATEDEDAASAAPSPNVKGGRLGVAVSREKGRGGSVPSTREVSVKIEDGVESVASSVEGTKPSEGRQRLVLSINDQVFYRNPKGKTTVEGEGILCKVTNVIGEGKQRRYEVQDADPEPGTVAQPYRANVSALVPIPTSNAGLPDLPREKHVLAQYPDTTTFYKAEVSTAWRAKDIGTERGELVRLKFEGEMEEAKETEVERRFVLVEKGA